MQCVSLLKKLYRMPVDKFETSKQAVSFPFPLCPLETHTICLSLFRKKRRLETLLSQIPHVEIDTLAGFIHIQCESSYHEKENVNS